MNSILDEIIQYVQHCKTTPKSYFVNLMDELEIVLYLPSHTNDKYKKCKEIISNIRYFDNVSTTGARCCLDELLKNKNPAKYEAIFAKTLTRILQNILSRSVLDINNNFMFIDNATINIDEITMFKHCNQIFINVDNEEQYYLPYARGITLEIVYKGLRDKLFYATELVGIAEKENFEFSSKLQDKILNFLDEKPLD